MSYFLIAILAVLMIMVVVSLVRGVVAFMKSTKSDLEAGDTGQASEMQLLQNKMMFNRIKFQAAAVLVVGVLLAMAS